MKRIIRIIFNCCLIFTCMYCNSQPLSHKKQFTRQDTLRGTITPQRAWWDVTWYGVAVRPDFTSKTIEGVTTIKFKVIEGGDLMQVDLQLPMQVKSATWNDTPLTFSRDGNAYFIRFPARLVKGKVEQITVSYAGKPREAVQPPWDGGWIWKTDKLGNPWMSVACQGLGASVWYPCKDHQSDEPDSASLSMTVPAGLVGVGNGRLRSTRKNPDGTSTYTWSVTNPINSYNIIPYIGKYANWTETIDGENGNLDCSYWVLEYNLEKAKEQFKQVRPMMKCFEDWFGPYPFYNDSYKLVESPHLGMEHQSAVAYGNEFKNGYLGKDLSQSGWGLKWDFIIIHESGHEWFGNNITANDIADMWIHEGFTNYSETIYTGTQFGKEAGTDYVVGLRKGIANDVPIIGSYGVNQEGSTDMYYKGANLLHALRTIINDDVLFKKILRGLNKTFYHQTVNSKDVEAYISKEAGVDFARVFDQYLRNTAIPVLEYKNEKGKLAYRWNNCVDGFDMSVRIFVNGGEKWLRATKQWQSMDGIDAKDVKADRNFYIQVKLVQ